MKKLLLVSMCAVWAMHLCGAVKKEWTWDEKSNFLSAVGMGKKETVEQFLKRGMSPDVKVCNRYVRTVYSYPLIQAARWNHEEIAELLYAYGASLHVCGSDGEGPLHAAVRGNALGITQMLVRHGADINALSEAKATPFALILFDLGYKEIEFEKRNELTVGNLPPYPYTLLLYLVSQAADIAMPCVAQCGAPAKTPWQLYKKNLKDTIRYYESNIEHHSGRKAVRNKYRLRERELICFLRGVIQRQISVEIKHPYTFVDGRGTKRKERRNKITFQVGMRSLPAVRSLKLLCSEVIYLHDIVYQDLPDVIKQGHKNSIKKFKAIVDAIRADAQDRKDGKECTPRLPYCELARPL